MKEGRGVFKDQGYHERKRQLLERDKKWEGADTTKGRNEKIYSI